MVSLTSSPEQLSYNIILYYIISVHVTEGCTGYDNSYQQSVEYQKKQRKKKEKVCISGITPDHYSLSCCCCCYWIDWVVVGVAECLI